MNIDGKHVARDADRDGPMILGESRLDVLNGRCDYKLESDGPALIGLERFRCGRIPLLRLFPFVLGKPAAQNHPIVEALERHSAWGQIHVNLWLGLLMFSPTRAQNRLVRFK